MVLTHRNSFRLGLEPEPNCCNGFYHTKTWTVAIRLVLPTKTWHFNLTSLAPIKYWSSDPIVTWSICRFCCDSRSCTSSFHICNPINIDWVAIQNLWILPKISCSFAATQQILVKSQFWQQQVAEQHTLHNLSTNHVTIHSELRKLNEARLVGTVKWNCSPVPL